jgi:Protein of unknown function (DUF3313)
MNSTSTGMMIRHWVAVVALTALAGLPAVADDELPATTPDGLELLSDTKVYAAYAKPGATLEPYTKVALLDCYVAFRKNWERDYNRDVRELDRRVNADDMEKIKARLAEEFKIVFTDELAKGGYEVVDHTGDEVLIVRPALVNLDVTAPDVQSASMSRTYMSSAGSMTLVMELFDSVTGDIIARVLDPQASDRGGFAMEGNRVTNKAEADRILRKWAGLLRSHLGVVEDATKTPEA